MNEVLLLRKILSNDWIDVKAMVTPGDCDALLDVVFITADSKIAVTGKAHSLLDEPEEAFSLAIYEHIKDGWWKEDALGKTNWQPRKLSDEWLSQSLGSMLLCPRDFHFYSDPRLQKRKFPAKDILDNCTAIEFTKETNEGGVKRLVLAASNDDPCFLKLGTTTDRCNMLLSGLNKIALGVAIGKGAATD